MAIRSLYIHPRETWTEPQCAKLVKRRTKDAFGTLHPFPGFVSTAAGGYPGPGQTVYYNGGCIREGEWYNGEYFPLPIIPEGYDFIDLPTWGIYLRKKGGKGNASK